MPYKFNPLSGDIDIVENGGGGGGSITFEGDTGSATPNASDILNLSGGSNGIDTVASGNTITFNFDVTEQPLIATSFVSDGGTAQASSNAVNIVGGTGITTSATGDTLTISFAGASFVWNEVTGTSGNLADLNGYITNNAGLVTMTLPATASIGDRFIVTGKGAGGWKVAQNAGQTINMGSSPTTTGVGGSLASTNQFDTIEIVCITANTTFNVINSIGNITVV